MICQHCGNTDGDYLEIEDFNPGGDPEWSNYLMWQCYNKACMDVTYSYSDGFEWPDGILNELHNRT